MIKTQQSLEMGRKLGCTLMALTIVHEYYNKPSISLAQFIS